VLEFEPFGPLVLAGIARRHGHSPDPDVMYGRIFAQWCDFVEVAHTIPALPPRLGYGIGVAVDRAAKTMDYFCGAVVASPERVPAGLLCFSIPSVRCAVFQHSGHVSRVLCTLEVIFATVLASEGLQPAAGGAPAFIERYADRFDPETGLGGLELLVPVR